jgi:Mg-chelatase subunit ChlD
MRAISFNLNAQDGLARSGRCAKRTARESGVSLMLSTMSLIFVIPMLGLMVDVGVIYTIKGRLQASVDGASLAAARVLALGSTTAAQTGTAKQNAVNWFYANFPGGNWYTGTTQMDASSVNVFDDPGNPNLRNVTVTASTIAPTYFMKWFNTNSVAVTAVGNASRRDVVIMMVLDRSGSMGGTCGTMKSAAKEFVGKFANGRDRIGLLSFSDNINTIISPTTDFRAQLGYTTIDPSGSVVSGTGAIDSITCAGGTNTASAIALGYNELYRTALPGAYNVLMFETDGLPNTLTLNWFDSGTSTAGIANGSGCKDSNNKTVSSGGFHTLASLPGWTPGYTMPSGSYLSNVPAGIVGSLYSTDPTNPPSTMSFIQLFQYYTTSPSTYINSSTAPSCTFTASHSVSSPSDFAWYPATDVWGNSLNPATNPYKSVTMNGTHVSTTGGWTNFHNAALNATDNAAYRARVGATLGNGQTLDASFFGIGLGGNSTTPPDYVLMQRMANDPNGDADGLYPACASAPGCITYNTQHQGQFIFAPSSSELEGAFEKIAAQILRLSK